MWEYAPYESPRRSSTLRPPSGVGLDHAKEDDIPFMLAFFDQVLGQLQPHHQFADLRTGQGQLTLLGITPRLQPPRPLLEEDALPALELMGRHLALARDRVERLAAQEPQDRCTLQRSGSSGISAGGGSLPGVVVGFRALSFMPGLLGCRHRSPDGVQGNRVRFRLSQETEMDKTVATQTEQEAPRFPATIADSRSSP